MAQLAPSISWSDQRPFLSARAMWVLGLIGLAHLALFVAMGSMQMVRVAVPQMVTMVKILLPAAPLPKTELTPPKPPRVLTSMPKPLPVLVSAPVVPLAPSPRHLTETAPSPVVAAAVPAPMQLAAPAPVRESPPPPVLTGARFDADYLDNPAPAYPPLSRRSNEEGKVVLRVYVEASGQPSRLEVGTSSGFERLDKAALAAVSRWRFVPARQGTEEVSAWVLVPIVFSLKS